MRRLDPGLLRHLLKPQLLGEIGKRFEDPVSCSWLSNLRIRRGVRSCRVARAWWLRVNLWGFSVFVCLLGA